MPGWQPLIVCTNNCEFSHLIQLTQNLITDLIILSTFLAVAAFVYAGVILLTSGGKSGKLEEARGIFMKVLIGYLWILGAWLLIYTITSVLLKPEFGFLLGKPN